MTGSDTQDPTSPEASPIPTPIDAALALRILEAAPTIIYVYDVQKGRSVFQNRRFGELLGHPPSKPVRPNDWTTFIHPEDAARFPAHRDRLKRIGAGETLSWEFRMRDFEGHWRWFLSRDALLSTDKAGSPLLVVGGASDISEQKHAEKLKELLADEMRHRARNLVAIVQAIGRMSRPKDMPEVNRHLDAFMGRLLALLNTGGIVLSNASRKGEFEEIVKSTLAPFAAGPSSRIAFGGPSIGLSEQTAGGLALAIHELATNAIKYGALSVDSGSVSLKWRVFHADGKPRFSMEWKEVGGPAVSPPSAEGFGLLVIRQSVTRESNHEIELDYAPAGLRCRLAFELPGAP